MASSLTASSLRSARQRGISLLESLVAVAVLVSSSLAVFHLQSQLRLAGDIARDRSQALRLGEAALESLRGFAVVGADPARRSYAAIASDDAVVAAASGAGPAYRIVRRVDAGAVPGSKTIALEVQWSDRNGAARSVALQSLIAGVDPAYAGSLGLAGGVVPAAPRGAGGRAPSIPVLAKDLGDGRSVLKPIERGSAAIVFDNASGAVVGRCAGIASATATRDLSSADLAGCATGHWLLVAGTIRFAASAAVATVDARDTPLPLGVAIARTDAGDAAASTCFSEARKTVRYVTGGSLHFDAVALDATPAALGLSAWDDSGDRFVAWHCVVVPRADARWSGRVSLAGVGWTIGAAGSDHRICRFVHAPDAAPIGATIAHSTDLSDIDHALVAENFLVVPGTDSCPRDPPTEPHQP